MKTYFLLFCIWITQCLWAQSSSESIADSSNYTSEKFSFLDASRKHLLEGVLTVPKQITSSTKVVIFVTPPLPLARDYHGLFSTLSDIFSKKGMVTLRFDNRAYTDKTLSPQEEKLTMFEQADDVHEALRALRKDKRFSYHSIGLLGHSEGGAVASVEAARNKEISFIVCLSALGVKGADIAYEQRSMPYKFFKKDANSLSYLPFLRKYIHIVDTCSSVDSMKLYLHQAAKEFYTTVRKEDKRKKMGKNSLEEYCQMEIRWHTRPRIIALIKYKPQHYYSKISCPALIMHGKMDGNMDCKKNLEGIEEIFKKNKKKNYEIIAIDSLDHSYLKVKEKIPLFMERMISRSPDTPKPKQSIETFEYIAKWINATANTVK